VCKTAFQASCKGGTTAAAIESMQSNKVSESIARGVVAARNRGRELGE